MIFLGIGSNLQSSFGNRFKNINLAISLIEKNNIKLIKKSSYYESTSFPNVKDPKFINIVIEVSTSLKPIDLMKILLKIEQNLERVRKNKNDPRHLPRKFKIKQFRMEIDRKNGAYLAILLP